MEDEKSENNEIGNVAKVGSKIVDIRERAFAFAVRIVKLCKFLEKSSNVSKNVIGQLLDAGTSIGANLEEAVAGKAPQILFTKIQFH
jgi:four helix bundle protein